MVPTITLTELATAVLKAQDIREASYKQGDLAPEGSYFGERYPGEYTLSHERAAELALPDSPFAHIVHLLNYTAWNDVQAWAEEQLGRET